jgi:hypothetical protein
VITHVTVSRVCAQDMDLLAENRSLIHAGKLLRQPDTGFEWSGWSELFVLLFDNYCKSSGWAGMAMSCIDCDGTQWS